MFIFFTETVQQSTLDNHGSENAVDGNVIGTQYQYDCTHTQLAAQPWWAVDLEERTCVYNVLVTNRNEFGSSTFVYDEKIGKLIKYISLTLTVEHGSHEVIKCVSNFYSLHFKSSFL